MADGTLKVGQIITSSGSGTITLGQSNETVALGSGATSTGFGGANTPAFLATLSSIQQTSDATTTKIQFNSESFDTDSCYDNSTNYRFTPTTAGKYFIYTSISGRSDSPGQLTNVRTSLYKNGSELIQAYGTDFRNSAGYQTLNYMGAVIDMNGSTDYIEYFARVDHTGGTNGGVDSGSYAGAYKIIE